MLFISIIILFILTVLNYHIADKKFTYPPFIFCAVWLVVMSARLIFTQFYLKDLFPLQSDTYFLFIAGCLVSTVAGYISLLQYSFSEVRETIANRQNAVENEIIHADLSLYVRLTLIGFCFAIFPLFVKYIIKVVLPGEVENIFKTIRYETAVNNVGFGIYNYMITLSCFVGLFSGYVYWQKKTRTNKIVYILALIVSLFYAFATMGRSPILMVISLNLAMFLISNQKVNIKQFILPLLVFVLIFLGVGILLDKGGSLNNSLSENVDASIKTFLEYLLTPMNAIDWVLHQPILEHEEGRKTLRFFYVLGHSLGLNNVNPDNFDIVDAFIFVPYPVNVYTFYSPYVKDFGALYSFLWVFVLMLIHSNTFMKLTYSSKIFLPRIIYSFMFFPLIMVFFHDLYISILSTWLQLLLIVGTVYFIFWCKVKGVIYFFLPVKTKIQQK